MAGSDLGALFSINTFIKLGEVLQIAAASEFVPGSATSGLVIPVRRKLRITGYIAGYSGNSIARLRVGTVGAAPDTTAANYGAAAMEDNAAKVTNLGAVAGINLASIADTDRRGFDVSIVNEGGRVKYFMVQGTHSPAEATGTALVMFVGSGIYTIAGQAPINCVQLWSGTAATTLSIGTHFEVWGAD